MTTDYSADVDVVVTGATGELGEAVARRLLLSAGRDDPPAGARSRRRPEAMYAGAAGDIARVSPRWPTWAKKARSPRSMPRSLVLWASIHCSGAFAMSPFDQTPLADFRAPAGRQRGVAAFVCCREADQSDARGAEARIVNVAAQPGVEPRRGAGMVAYAASKAAVAAITLAHLRKRSPRTASGSTRSCRRSWIPRRTGARCRPPILRSGPSSTRSPRPIAFLASPQNARDPRGARPRLRPDVGDRGTGKGDTPLFLAALPGYRLAAKKGSVPLPGFPYP